MPNVSAKRQPSAYGLARRLAETLGVIKKIVTDLKKYLKPFQEFYLAVKEGVDNKIPGELNEKSVLEFVVKGAFMKCLEFNLFTCQVESSESSYFQMATLRGICEDLIILAYLNTLSEAERNDYLSFQLNFEIQKSLIVQHEFLKK
ncbi:hypothetical protein HUW51_16345 [Adhaeribacter swui]|uniref:Uncharacterized protein n=1 Tax=Adhaeribacter swui TaxID=2086471 RepID=A0A7G7GAN0_9BACT|nr:hypothetical protein [Adhaeribacter swui]QNF34214.1 hypothetical protein HUW51_16345 [Adhaeribacter swui]